jgi:hypothetical protein
VVIFTGVMRAEDRLTSGDFVASDDGRFRLLYQSDGNLVLYDENGTALWSSDTFGSAPGMAVMQGDGNFVVYDVTGQPIWASMDSLGYPGASLLVQNDGNVVIYDAAGVPLWLTGTVQ